MQRASAQLQLLVGACLLLLASSHGHDHHGHHHHHHGHDHHDHGHHDHHHHHHEDELVTHPYTALALTFFSGFAASLGGLLVVCLGVPSPRALAHLLSFATGIMLYVSYADLLPHAVDFIDQAAAASAGGAGSAGEHAGHSHGPGQYYANVCMLAGMAAWGLVALVLPEVEGGGGGHGHSHLALAAPAGEEREEAAQRAHSSQPPSQVRKRASSSASSSSGSGVVSPRRASQQQQQQRTVPVTAVRSAAQRRMVMTGLIAALGVTLHNLPEGIVVYNSTLKGVCSAGAAPAPPGTWLRYYGMPADLRQCMGEGAAVAFAIALHNIPEGMAVAAPILAATGSAAQAMGLTLLSSAAEPLAAIVFGYFFQASYAGADKAAFDSVLWMVNAGVAGVMIALCLGELLPAAFAGASPKVRGLPRARCLRRPRSPPGAAPPPSSAARAHPSSLPLSCRTRHNTPAAGGAL